LLKLDKLSRPDAHGIVLMDKVGWHPAGDLILVVMRSIIYLRGCPGRFPG